MPGKAEIRRMREGLEVSEARFRLLSETVGIRNGNILLLSVLQMQIAIFRRQKVLLECKRWPGRVQTLGTYLFKLLLNSYIKLS